MAGTERVFYFVYWDNIDRKSYLYGSDLQIRKDRSVHFQNTMMPAGSVIQEWDSMETDTVIRKEPELPLLIEGRHYRIHVYAYADKERTVIMRLNFFDRQKKLVSYRMVDEEEVEIVCPPEAYRYSLQLINAGMGEFDFQCILIAAADRGEAVPSQSRSAEKKKNWRHGRGRKSGEGADSQEERQAVLRGDEVGADYCGKLINRDEKGVVLTVVVPPYNRRMVRLPDEENLKNIHNCVIAPVTIMMPEPFFRRDWIRKLPLPAGGGDWKVIHFVSYTRETDAYVRELADMYQGGFPVFLENERQLAQMTSF